VDRNVCTVHFVEFCYICQTNAHMYVCMYVYIHMFLNALLHLVNKTNSVHNLFLVYLSICTCFGRLCAHHQERKLYLCNTWYLLFCVDGCLVCRVECIPLLRINIQRINCAASWLYLQDYTGMHGQQNIKFCTPTCFDIYTSS